MSLGDQGSTESRPTVHGLKVRPELEVFAFHEPAPLTPALSANGGEGGRRPGEGDSRFMPPTHVRILEVFPIRETQGRAGLSLPGHGAR